MKLLSKLERDEIEEKKIFNDKIEGIINAHTKSLKDYVDKKGYQCNFKTKEEEAAYTIGWNKMAKLFPYNYETRDN